MGIFDCCLGGAAEESEVDRQLAIANLRDQLKFKILLLGSGESGKSTVLKQLKLIHKINDTPMEIKATTDALRRNTVQCMCILVQQAQTFGLEYASAEEKASAQAVNNLSEDVDAEALTEDMAENISKLWQSPTIQQTYARRQEFWLLDAAAYYFDNTERFVQDDYLPTEEDQVMARVMTTGIVTNEITSAPITLTVVDVGGQRNERRKWIHVFDNVNGIIFVVNLAGYNSVLFEDRTQNRMSECFAVFKDTVNNPLFADTPIFLLFNKKDLFETMIQKEPLTNCPTFADYKGGSDLQAALTYITAKFKSVMTSKPERLKHFHIAAKIKRDVKMCWDDIVIYLKGKFDKEIESAVKQLEAKGAGTSQAA